MSKIIAEGVLVKNDRDRYCINDEWELTSGMVVEVRQKGEWIRTPIEHDGEDYYFKKLPELYVWGCRVRLRDFSEF